MKNDFQKHIEETLTKAEIWTKEKNLVFKPELMRHIITLHTFFENPKVFKHNYKKSDYVLDDRTPFIFYDLINNQYNGILSISISNTQRKERVLNKLKSVGIDFVKIHKVRPFHIISNHTNNIKTNKTNKGKITNIWTYEKLFLYLDTFNIQYDQQFVAAKRLRQRCNVQKLLKLKNIHSSKSLPISKFVREYFENKEKEWYPTKSLEQEESMISFLENISFKNQILFGGLAVETYLKSFDSNNVRATMDIDFLAPKPSLKALKQNIRNKGYTFIDNDEVDYGEYGHPVSTINITGEPKTPNNKKTLFKIDIDHKISSDDLKALKDKGLINQISKIGNVLCPEGLICCKLGAITNNIHSKGWGYRIIKDVLDISLLYKVIGIDEDRMKKAFYELTTRKIISVDTSKFKKILEIIKSDQTFKKNLLKLVEANAFTISNFQQEEAFNVIFDLIKQSNMKQN